MALKKSLDTSFGFTIPDAYLRVEQIQLPEKSRMAFSVRAYANAAAASEGGRFLDDRRFECPFDLSGQNPIAQAYAHVKMLPEFAAAEDC